MKKIFLYSILLCVAVLTGCNRDKDPGGGGGGQGLFGGTIVIDNTSGGEITPIQGNDKYPDINRMASDVGLKIQPGGLRRSETIEINDYRFLHTHTDAPMRVDNLTTQASHVKVVHDTDNGGYVFVAFNKQYAPNVGGIRLYQYSLTGDKDKPISLSLHATMRFPDVNGAQFQANAIDYAVVGGVRTLYIAGAVREPGLFKFTDEKTPAMFVAAQLNGNMEFTENIIPIQLGSFQATSIRYHSGSEKIFVTAGDNTKETKVVDGKTIQPPPTDGGLFIFDARNLPESRTSTPVVRLDHARAVEIDDDNNVFVMQANPHAIVTQYDLSGNLVKTVYNGTDNMQLDAKSDAFAWNNYLFLAQNNAGLEMVSKDDGTLSYGLYAPNFEYPPCGTNTNSLECWYNEEDVTNSMSVNSWPKKAYYTNGNTGTNDVQSDLLLVANGRQGLFWYEIVEDGNGGHIIANHTAARIFRGDASANHVESNRNVVFLANGLAGLRVLFIQFEDCECEELGPCDDCDPCNPPEGCDSCGPCCLDCDPCNPTPGCECGTCCTNCDPCDPPEGCEGQCGVCCLDCDPCTDPACAEQCNKVCCATCDPCDAACKAQCDNKICCDTCCPCEDPGCAEHCNKICCDDCDACNDQECAQYCGKVCCNDCDPCTNPACAEQCPDKVCCANCDPCNPPAGCTNCGICCQTCDPCTNPECAQQCNKACCNDCDPCTNPACAQQCDKVCCNNCDPCDPPAGCNNCGICCTTCDPCEDPLCAQECNKTCPPNCENCDPCTDPTCASECGKVCCDTCDPCDPTCAPQCGKVCCDTCDPCTSPACAEQCPNKVCCTNCDPCNPPAGCTDCGICCATCNPCDPACKAQCPDKICCDDCNPCTDPTCAQRCGLVCCNDCDPCTNPACRDQCPDKVCCANCDPCNPPAGCTDCGICCATCDPCDPACQAACPNKVCCTNCDPCNPPPGCTNCGECPIDFITGGGFATTLITTGAAIKYDNPNEPDPDKRYGDVWVWGYRLAGIQGRGTRDILYTTAPNRATMPGNVKIKALAAGAYHLLALGVDGNVYGWGQNGYGEVGVAPQTGIYNPTPAKVNIPGTVVMIAAGEYCSIAMTSTGEVYTWGHNLYGQIGDGGRNNTHTPHLVSLPAKARLVGSAYEGGFAVLDNGTVWGWGDNEASGLGFSGSNYGVQRIVRTPTEAVNLRPYANRIKWIGGGNGWGQALLDNGSVIGWGLRSALGQGVAGMPLTAAAQPSSSNVVQILPNAANPNVKVKQLFARYVGSVALTTDGDVFTWGQTGIIESFRPIYGTVPTRRNTGGRVKEVGGGKESIFYLREDGQFWGVGYNDLQKIDMSTCCHEDLPLTPQAWKNWPGVRLRTSTNNQSTNNRYFEQWSW